MGHFYFKISDCSVVTWIKENNDWIEEDNYNLFYNQIGYNELWGDTLLFNKY